MSVQRMLPFLLLNILVSTITVIFIWTFLERRQPAVTVNDSALLVNSAEFSEQASGEPQPIAIDAPQNTPEPVDLAPTATPQPEGPPIHSVQAGESLGVISTQYGVSVEDIVAANALADANAIFVGQQLTIPVPGIEEAAAAPVEEVGPLPTETPIPTVAVQLGDTTFAISSISGVGDISAEQLLLVNTGPNTVLLAGWTLSNDQGSTYTFGDVTLFGNGAGITLHTGVGDNLPTDLYWGNTAPAWQSGQTIVLRDASGNLQGDVLVP